jgi:diguanylate cyclase (GGDEF)-like protein
VTAPTGRADEAAAVPDRPAAVEQAAAQEPALQKALRDLADAHVELARRQRFTDALLETIDVAIISCDADGANWQRNRAARDLLGVTAETAGPETASSLMDVLDADGRPLPIDEYPLARALRGDDVGVREMLAGPAGGPHREVVGRSARIADADGSLLGAVIALTDVSDERAAARSVAEAQDSAERANTFLNAVLAAMPDYVFVLELNTGRLVYGSTDRDVLGLSARQVEQLDPAIAIELVHPDDLPRLRATNVAAGDLEVGQVLQIRYRARHGDGQWRWLVRRVTPFRRDAAGVVVEVAGVLRDVTDQVAAEDALRHAALHDSLTGLPNRALLVDRLEDSLVRAAREGRQLAVLFCDLDGFKRVNDTAGHAAGDEVLRQTALRLQHVLREHDTVARVGGDEFVVLLEPWDRTDPASARAAQGAPDRDLAVDVARRLVDALSQPLTYDGEEHLVSVSIGIAGLRAGQAGRAPVAMVAEQLLDDADAAMYRAKSRTTDRIEVAFNDAR